MRNIKIVIEYDGSRYAGWKRLERGEGIVSIENKLLSVIQKMTDENVKLFCGSRTETGVHAYSQVANFKTSSPMKVLAIKQYFSRYLPNDIAVTSVEEMPERFHASLNAKSRTYLYRIAVGDVPCVFDRKYTYYCFHNPDIDLMKEAASIMEGKHDFRKFSAAKKTKSTVKEIYSIDIKQTEKEIQIEVTANDFLHNMARMMIATCLDVGLKDRNVEDIKEIFNLDSDIMASEPAKPQGLFLKHIEY